MSSDPGAAFTAITQIGTEAAVVLYFRRDIARIVAHWAKSLPVGPWKKQLPSSDPDARMGWFVIFGSITIVVLGLLFQDAIEHALDRKSTRLHSSHVDISDAGY